MKRYFFLIYGVVSYLIFFATILYAIGFIGNIVVPKTLDGPAELPLWQALLINAGLLGVFAVQHSGMARAGFKKWWTRIIPEPIERSTYVLISSLLMIALFWLWQPLGGEIWTIENSTFKAFIWGLFAVGWAILFASTFVLNHFDLFGLRQVWLAFQNKPYTDLQFDIPILYRMVRHPLYFGFLIAFWATPTMTVTHLVFAIACTGYILVGIYFEEKDLVKRFGQQYLDYKKRVPMLIPIPFAKKKSSTDEGLEAA